MGKYFTVALRNLMQAKRRTFLLSTALGSVSMLLVFMMSLTQGISDTRSMVAISIELLMMTSATRKMMKIAM